MTDQTAAQPPRTFGPYSPVRRSGDSYYVSGQVGVDPVTKSASGDLAGQVKQALDNLGATLVSVGLSYTDVVKTTLYLTDMSEFATVNALYVEYFEEPRPARTTVGVADLPHVAGDTKLLFEIEAVAARSSV